ncbi:MAG: hypothetical protein NVS3B20_10040 [Polyangiales bacterium]
MIPRSQTPAPLPDRTPQTTAERAFETSRESGAGSPDKKEFWSTGAAGGLPRAFGRYVLFDLIGKGGMAEIYLSKARTTEAGGSRLVVVKQILTELSANSKFAEALVQEAKLAARLSHANVVQVFDLGRAPLESESHTEGVPDVTSTRAANAEGAALTPKARANERLFIAMEYVEGLDLNELLRRCARAKVPLPIEFALLMVMETLSGLDYAHRRADDQGRPLCIVHRDVSPSNVLVSVDGEVKLCDFGIARANDIADALSPDAIQGKAGYMSPEQARGEPLDARADVFAAGVILWELIAGRRLYRANKDAGESLLAVARRAEIPPLPLRGLAHEGELHAMIAKALAIDPSGRFQSAAAMLEAIRAYVGKTTVIASPIRLGEWLTAHFGKELVATRRARERAVQALELGAAATITPLVPAVREPPLPSVRPEATAESGLARPSDGARPAEESGVTTAGRSWRVYFLVVVILILVVAAMVWFFARTP